MNGSHADFVHLHLHTTYSFLDAAVDISKLAIRAKELNMPAIAMTDHGNMFGAIEFYNKVIDQGIKPIIGCEFYLVNHDRTVKEKMDSENSYYHLVLLAKNQEGYDNLIKLCSTAYLDGFYYKPRIDKKVLADCSKGLIASSACIIGEIPKAILSTNKNNAEKIIYEYKEIFGQDNFFLELMDHGIPEEKTVNEALIELSKKTNTELIATNDVHYIERSDAKAQDVYLCIGTGKYLSDENRMKFHGSDFYLKSADEMKSLFEHVPDALRNTVHIADSISFDMKYKYGENEKHLPVFKVPENYTQSSYLEELCYKGLKTKYEETTPELKERLDYELKVIKEMRFPGYFLIVQDFINWAKSNDIAVGPGRGSAAGSLVAYTLGITNIDPLRYGLFFERFLNPGRREMPDIDTDFEDSGRSRVIEYVREKYGDDKVAQIITFGTLKAKMAVRDVCRVMEIPIEDANKIAKKIPEGPKVTLDKAMLESSEFRDLINSNTQYREMFEIAKKLEGLRRNSSIHAAGIVIGDEELKRYVPLYRDPKKGLISTQFEGGQLEKCGLLKMDFLGLKNLSVIKNAVRIIKQTKNIDIDTDKIPLDDENTYELLRKGKSVGVFQLESGGMQELLKNLQPDNFEEIIALIALYRPGPLGSGMDKTFANRKFKREKVEYPHTDLEPVLKTTYGLFIYQEQVMKIAQIIGGFSLAKADNLRKAMGKKKIDQMAKLREEFINGAVDKKYDKKFAEKLYDDMANFAEYGFNKSHSAAYAVIVYITAYLKAHFPVEYMCALLTVYKGDIEDVAKYLNETRSMGITVLPPNIKKSFVDFSVEHDSIRFGLSAMQNVGEKAALNLIGERDENGEYKTLFDLTDRVDLRQCNKKVLEALCKSGAFDSFSENRKSIFDSIEDAIAGSARMKQIRATGQMDLFGTGGGDDDEEQGVMEDYRALVNTPDWAENEKLKYEKEILGVYMTAHPLTKYEDYIILLSTHDTEKIKKCPDNEEIKIAGLLSNVQRKTAKSGHRYAIVEIEDFEGTIDGFIFRDNYTQYETHLAKDSVVIIEGNIKAEDEKRKLFINRVQPLNPEELPRIRRFLHILLKDDEIRYDRLNSLKKILYSHRGETAVYLHLRDENDIVRYHRLGDDFSVSINDDLKHHLSEHICVNKYYVDSRIE